MVVALAGKVGGVKAQVAAPGAAVPAVPGVAVLAVAPAADLGWLVALGFVSAPGAATKSLTNRDIPVVSSSAPSAAAI